ncbi:MAG: alpha/beta family hydrolase [Kineosporiaceae bacterium]
MPSSEQAVTTSAGPARVLVQGEAGGGLLVLGHGAGGGIDAVDLRAVASAAAERGWRALLVEQPWRVAGRKVAPPPAHLDRYWLEVLEAVLPGLHEPRTPLVVGGRSAGARVACRTAGAVGADAVMCLAFPLHPPGRPERSRAEELRGAGVPVTVVQGERDAFGRPDEVVEAVRGVEDVRVHAVPGDHALKADPSAVAAAVVASLPGTPGV